MKLQQQQTHPFGLLAALLRYSEADVMVAS